MKSLIAATALSLSLATTGLVYAAEPDMPKGSPEMPMPPSGQEHGHFMDKVLAKLPPEKAKLLRDASEKSRDKNKEIFSQLHQKHEEMRAIVTAPKFDAKAYLAKNAEIQKLHDQMKQNMDEGFASVAGQLTQDERKTFDTAMEDSMHFGHHHMMPKGKEAAPSAGGAAKQ